MCGFGNGVGDDCVSGSGNSGFDGASLVLVVVEIVVVVVVMVVVVRLTDVAMVAVIPDGRSGQDDGSCDSRSSIGGSSGWFRAWLVGEWVNSIRRDPGGRYVSFSLIGLRIKSSRGLLECHLSWFGIQARGDIRG